MKKAWGSDFKNRRAGAAAIEFAIVGPFFLLLVVGMIVYGGWLWMAHSVQAAVSEARARRWRGSIRQNGINWRETA